MRIKSKKKIIKNIFPTQELARAEIIEFNILICLNAVSILLLNARKFSFISFFDNIDSNIINSLPTFGSIWSYGSRVLSASRSELMIY